MSSAHVARLVSLASIALSAGCDASGGMAAAGLDIDNLPALALEEELRIGSLDDPDLGFSRIGGVQVAADGTVFVLEAQDRQVRVYDAQGRLLRRMGGPGSGPGEMQSPSGFQLLGDTVLVQEMVGNRRVTLYGRDGELLATVPAQGVEVPIEQPNMRVEVRPSRLRPDGLLEGTVVYSIFSLGPGVAPPPAPDSVSVPRVLFDKQGLPVDTLGWYAYPLPPSMTVGTVSVSRSPALPTTPFRLSFGADTVVVERPVATDPSGGVLTVTRIRESGDTAYRQPLRYAPRPVEAAYRDSVLEARLASYRTRQPPVDLLAVRRAIEAVADWPAFHPPVTVVRLGSDGAPWLRREALGERVRWTLLHADGSPRGELVLDPSVSIQWSDAERLWAIERDAFDVPWLVRYRITGG
jgi:hypothetical protein